MNQANGTTAEPGTESSAASSTDTIRLAVFESRLAALCETMGAVLRRSAFSPNIRDRLDFSCALFDAAGSLLSQATHIPVHLGSMAWAMRGLVDSVDWSPGDRLILNDPYKGGTHLPDVTLIAPVFAGDGLIGFVANRAHHADIGSAVPGSMPISRNLDEEGVLIAPVLLYRAGKLDEGVLQRISEGMRNPGLARGDFQAQIAASANGERALAALFEDYGRAGFAALSGALNEYAGRLARALLADLPEGEWSAADRMDDDGLGGPGPEIRLRLTLREGRVRLDFTGTDAQVAGNLNCPLSVTAAAVYYAFRCLLPADTPDCAGSLEVLELSAPEGCLVNAKAPAAVAAGNVETSQRLVDVVLKALSRVLPERIPAASQGTMNNLGMGSDRWSYYETLAGGCGATRDTPGRHCAHSHMTNTLNTPVEVLETTFPLRVIRYQRRRGSGGNGRSPGGDGVIREFEMLEPVNVTLITERRRHPPWGLAGGADGKRGENLVDGEAVAGKCNLELGPGQRLTFKTPGGGGWGAP